MTIASASRCSPGFAKMVATSRGGRPTIRTLFSFQNSCFSRRRSRWCTLTTNDGFDDFLISRLWRKQPSPKCCTRGKVLATMRAPEICTRRQKWLLVSSAANFQRISTSSPHFQASANTPPARSRHSPSTGRCPLLRRTLRACSSA